MSLFSGNRKVRSRRPKTVQEASQELSPRGKSRQLDKQSDQLRQQIYRLECMITEAPHLQRQHRLSNVNTLPPIELPSPVPRGRRIPLAQQRAHRSQRLRLLTECVIVFGCIAAVIGWLNQWFHFWN
jgi:hypothetical protein